MPEDELTDVDEKDEQARDRMLKKLMKTPPESREQLRAKIKAWKEQEHASSSTGKKRGPSA